VIDLVPNLIAGIGLLAAAAGAGGIAVVAAKQLGLESHLVRLLPSIPRSPERTLDLMVYCADIAAQEGLLRLESQIATSGEPLLIRGVGMALEGRSEAEIRDVLEQSLENSARRSAGRARLLGHAGVGMQVLGIVLATGLLLACLALAGGLAGSLPGLLMLLGGMTGLLAIVAGTVSSDAAGLMRASESLCDLIIAEGVLLLQAGRDSRAMAQVLSRYLPPAEMPMMLAKAA
jgi:flagellar motor component MotA